MFEESDETAEDGLDTSICREEEDGKLEGDKVKDFCIIGVGSGLREGGDEWFELDVREAAVLTGVGSCLRDGGEEWPN